MKATSYPGTLVTLAMMGIAGGTAMWISNTAAIPILGVLMIGLINNGLILMGLEFSQRLIARGVIILLAVTVGRSRK